MTESQFIPDGIVTAIFSRLPCKSLLRFKSGCQSWYSLISDPDFITLHCNRSPRNPKLFFNSRRLYFLVFDLERSSFKQFCCSSLRFPLEPEGSKLTILGSSCGLVCVAHHRSSPTEFYLWNPFTRELRNIPCLEPKNDCWHLSYAHGLGYDPVSNNLKLFVSKWSSYTCKVFCMKSNSWKSIKCPAKLNSTLYPLLDPKAVVVDGVFHWVINGHLRSVEIVGYDSTKHKFLEVAIPPVKERYGFEHASLLKHKGLLCISFCRRYVEEEIWMLKNHSWARFLNVSTRHPPQSESPYRPICIDGRSRVILHNEIYILRSTKGVEETEKIAPRYSCIQAITCFETLISPNHIILKK